MVARGVAPYLCLGLYHTGNTAARAAEEDTTSHSCKTLLFTEHLGGKNPLVLMEEDRAGTIVSLFLNITHILSTQRNTETNRDFYEHCPDLTHLHVFFLESIKCYRCNGMLSLVISLPPSPENTLSLNWFESTHTG